MRKFISYGKPSFDSTRFKTVNNHLQTKPGNGFWGCDYNPNGEYYSDWEQWFIEEYHQYPGEFGAVTFKIKDDAKIFVIRDKRDFISLMQKYPLPYIDIRRKPNSDKAIPYVDNIAIDFRAMAKDFDGIEFSSSVCQEQDWEKPFYVDIQKLKIQLSEEEKNIYRNSYDFVKIEFPKKYLTGERKKCIDIKDWAVPSICIFNPDVITDVEIFEPDHHQNIIDNLKNGLPKSEIIANVTRQIKRPEFVPQIMEYSELDYQRRYIGEKK